LELKYKFLLPSSFSISLKKTRDRGREQSERKRGEKVLHIVAKRRPRRTHWWSSSTPTITVEGENPT